MQEQKIKIETKFIKLDSLLKFSNIVITGGEAKQMIQEGKVMVNDIICTMRGKKLYSGDKAEISGKIRLIVE